MNDMQIKEDKTYTLPEVIDFVKQTLDHVSEKSMRNPLRYSATDVYWLLYDIASVCEQEYPGCRIYPAADPEIRRVLTE